MIYYGLLLLIVFDYFRPEVYIPFLKVPGFASIGLLVGSLFIQSVVKSSEVLKLTNTRWLLFYLILLIVSVLTADLTVRAFNYFRGVFGYFILYFLIAKEINSIERIKTLSILLIIVHIFVALLNPEVFLNPASRSYINHPSFLGDGNDFAWSVCVVMPFAIFFYQESKSQINKIMSACVMVVFMLCIIGSASRGASISLAVIIMYQWISSRKKIIGAVIISSIIISVFIFAPSSYFNRMQSIKTYQTDGSAQGRIMAWKSAVRMAIDKPFTGVGTGNFAMSFGVDYRPEGHENMPWLNAHSIYFKTLGELGFPGIIFLLSIIYYNFNANRKRIEILNRFKSESCITLKRLLFCLNSSIIGWAVAGTFLSGINYPHLYVICGLSSSIHLIYNRELNIINMNKDTL